MLLLLHKMLLSNIRDDAAGRFSKEGDLNTSTLLLMETVELGGY